MADPLQIAQATELEIPVTVQGSKTVEGTERRELFTETTKTTLVSENGAVLKLNARVLPGQCVFLQNDLSGREILCKVLDSRQAGEGGYTDLEFTVYDPKFWEDYFEQPAAAVGQKPVVQKGIEAPVVSMASIPTMESSAPTSGEVPATLREIATAASACPLPETTEASPEASNDADGTGAKDALPDWDEANDAELLAVLAAMGGEPNAQPESAPKETKGTTETGREVATADVREQGQTRSKIASEATLLSVPAAGIRRIREIMTRQVPISVGIAASLLIAAGLGFAWHWKKGSSTHRSNRPPEVSAQSAQRAQPVAAQLSQTPSSTAATSITNAGAASSQSARNIQQLTETRKAGVAATQNPAATTADAGAARSNKDTEDSVASTGAEVAASRGLVSSDQAATGDPIHRKPLEVNTGGTNPAKILSQAPPSIPPWAKGLDIDTVVQLDALIDEKGNVVETKPISGPRFLQPAAQRAVVLWVFEPALSDGKPTATRMVLTVQFQK